MKKRTSGASATSYDAVSIMLHWITAFVVIAIFALALAPGVVKGSIALHNTLGLLLLVLVPLRAVWRFGKGGAVKHDSDAPLVRFFGTLVHGALYVLLVLIPVLGLMYVDAKGISFTPFGLHLPQVVNFDSEFGRVIYGWKKVLSYAMLALIFFHATAAVAYHHWLRRDHVLRSMLPGRRSLGRVRRGQLS
jgi:cytochrome b561